MVLLAAANGANAQERQFFSKEGKQADANREAAVLGCSGPISSVSDVGYEGVLTTTAVFGSSPGGGAGGQFDKTPVLSTKVELTEGTCLDAHLSAIIGSSQTYGQSRLTLFQVTLTPSGGGPPQHMFGHYETPYGIPSPAVAAEAERDVDMFAANFFQVAGKGPHQLPPDVYIVDVWWAGAPPTGSGGAIGAASVLKLYMR